MSGAEAEGERSSGGEALGGASASTEPWTPYETADGAAEEPLTPTWAPHGSVPSAEPGEGTAAWTPYDTGGQSGGAQPPGPSEVPQEWGGGEAERETRPDVVARPGQDEPYLPVKGLSAEPPVGAVPAPRPGDVVESMGRGAMADAFVGEFVGGTTWRAMLAVLESAFPGLGIASALSRRSDVALGALDRKAATSLGVPAWLDDAGMVFDLSAHQARRPVRSPMPGRAAPPRASRPYAGAFVIDTLDPLRYHRAVGGPRAPRDLSGEGALRVPPGAEDDDGGVVVVAKLTEAGVRVLDSAALWRYAGRVVTGTLHEPGRPETRARVRRALRALRQVVVVDPDLRLGLCLRIDAARVPRCLLAFGVDEEGAARFVRP
ncbi:hypothetical protein SAMN05443665_101577 [Actinomadura meyerae]|uniref:Uncharacterized protein n=1 Tax=Actinomadura meyerae TaxID=240840 RepID=A0A239JLV4_9ACTN|nr:hypothetical protein [Actinomadura meyerae]SNT06815.1 hypothetical protein SAMN05443665_101577 [Actinomadura meyerae]